MMIVDIFNETIDISEKSQSCNLPCNVHRGICQHLLLNTSDQRIAIRATNQN